MRILTLGLIMTCVACGKSPEPPVSKPVTQTQSVPTPAAQTSAGSETSREVASDATSSNDQIQASDVASVMNSAPATPAAMDMASMEQQVQAAFAQNNKLGAQQANALSGASLELIKAANAGDQAAVTKLSNKLLKQALFAKGFGLLDPAGIVQAIMDLIAAAANADVAGIIKAIQDFAAALA